MAIRTERAAVRLVALAMVVAGCGPSATEIPAELESWSVTAWGERYEVFPEVGALIAGSSAVAHTHVTSLDGFLPLVEGQVEVVLESDGVEQVFAASQPVRPGIFAIEVTPQTVGDYDLAFRIQGAGGTEEIRGGVVRVGTVESPGGVIRAPAPRGASEPAEPQGFLKEQQWRTSFATEWVRRGRLAESVRGLARVRPRAGSEALLTANLDGVVQPQPWPYPGQVVKAGTPLFRIAPRVATERSLAELEAVVTELEVDAEAARVRAQRLQELLAQEATSRRQAEEAQARATALAARLEAARRDLKSATSTRQGRSLQDALVVRAPFDGRVAEVAAAPGAAIAAGELLGRLVGTGAVWLEVALAPAAATELAGGGAAGLVLEVRDASVIRLGAEAVRLVSIAPEVDPATGTVTALLEVDAPSLILGTTLPAEVLLGAEREGVVVAASAVIDDGGVPAVYLQLSGERFIRQPVEVLARQGDRLLVGGLEPGQRLVTRGGEAIRRAGLMATDAGHGHVH